MEAPVCDRCCTSLHPTKQVENDSSDSYCKQMLRSVSDLLLAYLLYMYAQASATACCLTVNLTTSFLVDHRSVAVDPCTISAFESDLFSWNVWIWIQMRVA